MQAANAVCHSLGLC
ncbi:MULTISPECIES: hypothetical protein [Bacteria]